jgi:RNA polymerase-interacting CarD/CdnL/TRCF family regulator
MNTNQNNNPNPLLQEINLPGISIQLPTAGVFYEQGTFAEGTDPTDLMVRPFTSWDEVEWRNPYSIMSGKANRSLIQKVAPSILKPDNLCAVDVDMIFLGARQASYGNELEMDVVCENKDCRQQTKTSVRLDAVLLQYKSLLPIEQWQIELPNKQIVQLRPVLYTDFINTLKLIIQTTKKQEAAKYKEMSEEEEEQIIDSLVNQRVETIRDSVMFVRSAAGNVIVERNFINEWLDSLPASWFHKIQDMTEELFKVNQDAGKVTYECQSCGHEQKINVALDPTRFFGIASVK